MASKQVSDGTWKAPRELRRSPSVRRGSQSAGDDYPPLEQTSSFGLALGPPLNGASGGQGRIRSVLENPELVYKEYHTPLKGAVSAFRGLVNAGEAIGASHEGHDFFWPTRLFGSRDQVEGYTMRRIPSSYTLDFMGPRGNYSDLGQLMHALPRTGAAFGLLHKLRGVDRVNLAALVASGLDRLHRGDVIYRDISLLNIVFSVRPLRVGFMDMDSARPIAQPILPSKDGMDTNDWRDPLSHHPIGFDMDRYKLAVLAYRLLIAHNPSTSLTPEGVAAITHIDGVAARDAQCIKRLLFRALGPAGTRPPASEWHAVLTEAARRQ